MPPINYNADNNLTYNSLYSPNSAQSNTRMMYCNQPQHQVQPFAQGPSSWHTVERPYLQSFAPLQLAQYTYQHPLTQQQPHQQLSLTHCNSHVTGVTYQDAVLAAAAAAATVAAIQTTNLHPSSLHPCTVLEFSSPVQQAHGVCLY